MKRTAILVIGILLTTFVSSVTAQDKWPWLDPRYHFGLALWSDWQQIPGDVVEEYGAYLSQVQSEMTRTVAAFQQVGGSTWFERPFVVVQLYDQPIQKKEWIELLELVAEGEGLRFLSFGLNAVIDSIVGFNPDIALSQLTFDDSLNSAMWIGESKDGIEISSQTLYRLGLVNLHFYPPPEQPLEAAVAAHRELLQSLGFLPDYEYRPPNVLLGTRTGRMVLWVILGAFAGVAIFVFKKSVSPTVQN